MEWWKLIWWAGGTLGAVGLIVLLVYFPAIIGALFRFFGFVLSYRAGCALVAAVVVGLAVDYWRHSTDDADYAERVAQFEQAQKARDIRIAKEAGEAVRAEIASEAAAKKVDDTEVKEFHDALPPIPATGNPFRVGADADRLRLIAGQPVRRPASHQKVPKPRRRPLGI